VLQFSTRVLVALGITLCLVFLSIFPDIGYHGSARVNRTSLRYYGLYAMVNYTYSIIFNPLTYPFTWLHGDGISSGDSSMMVLPEGTMYSRLRWPGWREMEADALTQTVYFNIPPNFLMLFVIFIAIEFAKMRLLYVCLIGGIIGFIPGGVLGALITFSIGVFIVAFSMTKLNKKVLAKIRNIFGKSRQDIINEKSWE